jgi:hypothetical protein
MVFHLSFFFQVYGVCSIKKRKFSTKNMYAKEEQEDKIIPFQIIYVGAKRKDK